MSARVGLLTGGSNVYSTPSYDVMPYVGDMMNAGVITGLVTTAQGTPNMTVAVSAGSALVTATPSSESARLFRYILSASSNVTISSNSSGSTKYDLVYILLPAATLQNPPVSGDFTEAATLLTERHSAAGESLTATNGLLIAEVTVANGASSITSSNIVDKRTYASFSTVTTQTGQNLLNNGNFINASTNGYGVTADDWTNSSANPVQGGFPAFTKQNMIDLLGVADGDIEGLWNLNGDFTDLSSNAYNLTASGSPTDSSDGLMAQGKTFASASSQYANNAAANTNITGSQTWVAYIKPSSIATAQAVMGLRNSGGGNERNLTINTTGTVDFSITGLTTTTTARSDVLVETGKWYMVVGVYDSANTKLKIWVNGIKKEYTASGSGSAVTSGFSIGRNGDNNQNYVNGTVNNCSVLSVALSDDQVKRLWAATSYKGSKIRRAGSDGYIYQDLPQDLVERLRGKSMTLRASMNQAVASTGQISIYDGTETASTTSTTTGSFNTISVNKTISSTATGIQIRLKHSTTNGNTWFKEVALYEGTVAMPYAHSEYDWNKMPQLLKMQIPVVSNGYRYAGRNILGYAAITSNFTSTAVSTYTDVTGLSLTINVPTGGRKVKITAHSPAIVGTNTGTGGTILWQIWESSTQVGESGYDYSTSDATDLRRRSMDTVAHYYAAAGSRTFKVVMWQNTAGTMRTNGGVGYESFILVEED